MTGFSPVAGAPVGALGSGSSGGVPTPAVRQHGSAIGTGSQTPGTLTLASAPVASNLIIAFLNVDIALASLTINASGWTMFDACGADNDAKMVVVGLYRYAQSGDSATLPAFCTAGSTYWSATAYEIANVSGSWETDYQGSTGYYAASGTAISSLTQVTGTDGCLALLGFAKYDGSSVASGITGGWTFDENHASAALYGLYGSASQHVSSAYSAIKATVTVPSGSQDTGILQVVICPSQPSTPTVRQARVASGHGTPSSITLHGTPAEGNLLILFLSWSDGSAAAPSIGTGWNQFDQASHGSNPQMMAFYRYVEAGDTAALPTLVTSGSQYWAVTVQEISGVAGTWADDYTSSANGWQGSGSTLTSTAQTTSVNNQLVLLGASNYDGSADFAVPAGGWDYAATGHNFSNYGTYATFARTVPDAETVVTATITATASGHGQAFIQVLLGGGGTPVNAQMLVTNAGLEVWVTDHATVELTQAGLEVWLAERADARATQIGLEVWQTTTTGVTVVALTQMGLEVWEFIPYVPPNTQGAIIVIMCG